MHVRHTVHAVVFIRVNRYISHSSLVDRHTLVQLRQHKLSGHWGQRISLSSSTSCELNSFLWYFSNCSFEETKYNRNLRLEAKLKLNSQIWGVGPHQHPVYNIHRDLQNLQHPSNSLKTHDTG